MRSKINWLLVLFLLPGAGTLMAQRYYPVDVFRTPLDTPLYLSAPFGSLRENHFHSGMDIRTGEKEGLPVYAVAAGHISRIKISTVGYGKAVYIDHPNGYTTVYGHLQRFEGQLADYIRKYQTEKETFDFDHFPGKRIEVSKGQIIGYSGNSGSSTGPHLHFEIRNTKSEEPLNPLLFGIPVSDSIGPYIKRVVIYNLDGNRPVLVNDFPVNRASLRLRDSTWYSPDTIDVAMGTIGFGLEAYDHMIGPTHEYSLYSAEAYLDNRQLFGFRLDRLSFNDTRCINVHIDYELYRKEGVRFQKCFLDDGNRGRIYHYMRNRGKVSLNDADVHEVVLVVYDFAGRSFRLSFPVRGFRRQPAPGAQPCKVATFYPGRNNVYRTRDVRVEVPARALYDTLPFCLEPEPKDKPLYSPSFRIHDHYTPLDKSMEVSIRVTSMPADPQKLLLAWYTKEGMVRSAGGTFRDGWVTARTSSFGTYFVFIDTIAPTIRPLMFDKELFTDSVMKFRVDDNFSGIASWKATLNGKWILTEYDPKSDLITWEVPREISGALSEIALTVNDRKGNTTTYTRQFRMRRD
jgi:hypothetical protein